jgi:polysaccharide pyruvyl transferase WcaK-like protein/NAD-dependent dihydropyrimidine dehydrogenase PreA subunit
MKILVTNLFNFFNRGEVMQLEALSRNLEAELSILSIYSYVDRKVCDLLGVKVVGTHKPRRFLATWALLTLLRALLWRLTRSALLLNKELRTILESDLIVDLGGDTFSDEPSILYTIAHSYSLFLAKILGKPYVVLSQSIGPFKMPITKALAKAILKGALAVTAREPLTYEYLTKDLGLENVYLAPDIALASPLSCKSQRDPERHVVGLNASPLVALKTFPRVNERNDRDKKLELFVRLMGELLDYAIERYSCRALLIPHVTGPMRAFDERLRDDRVVLKMILGATRNKYEIELISSDDLLSIGRGISSCSVLVACRFHAALSAMLAGIPTILLSYSNKALGLAEMLGLHDYVIDVRDKDYEELKDHITLKLKRVFDNYEEVLKAFTALREATKGAHLHVKVVKGWRLLLTFKKRAKRCTGCGTCVAACPGGAVTMVLTKHGDYRPRIDFEKCTTCGVCLKACPLE